MKHSVVVASFNKIHALGINTSALRCRLKVELSAVKLKFMILICPNSNAMNYTVSGKKGATLFFAITLPNPNRSSKFFYRHTQQKICNKESIKYPTIIHQRCYTTL